MKDLKEDILEVLIKHFKNDDQIIQFLKDLIYQIEDFKESEEN